METEGFLHCRWQPEQEGGLKALLNFQHDLYIFILDLGQRVLLLSCLFLSLLFSC